MKIPDPQFSGTHSARSLALEVLFECRRHEGYISELLDKQLRSASLSPADRRLATSLAFGVLRRRGTLDALLRPLIARPMHKVEDWLGDLLRLGAFQLVFLSHVPAHAALFETVELTTRLERTRAKGFVNGVLRSLLRTLTDEITAAPAPDAIPLEPGRFRKLAMPLLPDPDEDPGHYLASGYSLPELLAERWMKRYGFAVGQELGFWFLSPAPMILRCNALRCERDAALQVLAAANIHAHAGQQPHSIRLTESMPVHELPNWDIGWFSVQDESAMEVVQALNPRPGATILDLCAAPGGKTAYLAECMGNQGRIIACDVDADRLQMLQYSTQRLGINIVNVLPLGREEPPTGPFDAVLVDVPCSNTGVLGRRPEVRWRMRGDDIRRLVPQQTQLLSQACARVRQGGVVVYSTCSIEPDENQQVVRNVLQRLSNFELEAEKEQFPGRPADGGYWARLRSK